MCVLLLVSRFDETCFFFCAAPAIYILCETVEIVGKITKYQIICSILHRMCIRYRIVLIFSALFVLIVHHKRTFFILLVVFSYLLDSGLLSSLYLHYFSGLVVFSCVCCSVLYILRFCFFVVSDPQMLVYFFNDNGPEKSGIRQRKKTNHSIRNTEEQTQKT